MTRMILQQTQMQFRRSYVTIFKTCISAYWKTKKGIDKFLGTYDLPKMNQKDVKNLN
jgi:hypothetical protein